MVGAKGEVWQGVVHNKCVFHKAKNVYSHLRPLFGLNVQGWKEVHDMFWKIAKRTDISSVEE